MKSKIETIHLYMAAVLIGVMIWSVINPYDYLTWFLEAVPLITGITIIIILYPKFRFTNLTYFLVLISFILILIGAHYTFPEVPFFDWLAEKFNLRRNHYDRLGHVALGVTVAIITREVLLRKTPLKQGKTLFIIVASITLGAAAMYELAEWVIVMASGGHDNSFLGAQGDNWDAQWDMFLGLLGAIVALMALGSYHDKLIENIKRQ